MSIVYSTLIIFFLFSSDIVQARHVSEISRTKNKAADVWNFRNYQPETNRMCTNILINNNKTTFDCQECTNSSYILLTDGSYSCFNCPDQYAARGHPYCHKLVSTDRYGNNQCLYNNHNNETETRPCTDCPYGGNYISTGPYFQTCPLDDDPRGLCMYTCKKCDEGMVARGHTRCKSLFPKNMCRRFVAGRTMDDIEKKKEEDVDEKTSNVIPCQKCPNGNYITGGSTYLSCPLGRLCQYQCINCPKGLYATGHSECDVAFSTRHVLLVLLLLLFPCLFVVGRVLFLELVKRCRTKVAVVRCDVDKEGGIYKVQSVEPEKVMKNACFSDSEQHQTSSTT